MRFDPWKCPQCDKPAEGMLEMVLGIAGLMLDTEGSAEYDGGTDVRWDSQTPVRNQEGRVTLECQEGHQWSAEFTPDGTGS